MRHKEQQLTRAHLIKECRKWQSALNDLRTRNVQLKEQLSQAIHGEVSLSFVEQAEFFQQQFVEKDQIIDLLRHDINSMLSKISENEMICNEIPQYNILQKDIAKLIDEFQQMEMYFSRFTTVNKSK
jgi:hypothetical protein